MKIFRFYLISCRLFGPVVEHSINNPDAFLIESPTEAYENGHVAKKPWINGMTSHEGLTGILGKKYEYLRKNEKTCNLLLFFSTGIISTLASIQIELETCCKILPRLRLSWKYLNK